MTVKLLPFNKQTILNNHFSPKASRLTQKEVASVLGISARGVYRVLKEAGITPRKYTKQTGWKPLVVRQLQTVPKADPHAELRKAWKEGQRWQYWWPTGNVWRDTPQPAPLWHPLDKYRRHPDDLASEQVPPALGASLYDKTAPITYAQAEHYLVNATLKEQYSLLTSLRTSRELSKA